MKSGKKITAQYQVNVNIETKQISIFEVETIKREI
jgi:hypothetical protein